MKKIGPILCILFFASCQNAPVEQALEENDDRASQARQKQIETELEKQLPAPDTLYSFAGQADLEDSLGSTYIDLGAVALILQGEFPITRKGDTLYLEESPGLYTYQKLLKTEVLLPGLELKVYFSRHERIDQVYPWALGDPQAEEFASWRERAQHWQAWTEYVYLPLESGNYRLPMLNQGHNQEARAELYKSLSLRDTFIDYPGEMGGYQAEFLFIGQPAAFYVPEAVLKVEVYDEEVLKREYYIQINFSYGC